MKWVIDFLRLGWRVGISANPISFVEVELFIMQIAVPQNTQLKQL